MLFTNKKFNDAECYKLDLFVYVLSERWVGRAQEIHKEEGKKESYGNEAKGIRPSYAVIVN